MDNKATEDIKKISNQLFEMGKKIFNMEYDDFAKNMHSKEKDRYIEGKWIYLKKDFWGYYGSLDENNRVEFVKFLLNINSV